MKTILYILIFMGLAAGCTHEPENPKKMDLNIRLLGTPQCLHLKSPESAGEIPDSQSCIEFQFDQNSGILLFKHMNAGFNCCPESLWFTAIYRNDTIIIQEYEKHAGCKCNCLYDLDGELTGLVPGIYQLRLVEPNCGNQDKLNFELDLRTQKQGRFCVSRTNYPWGK